MEPEEGLILRAFSTIPVNFFIWGSTTPESIWNRGGVLESAVPDISLKRR
jgi:hypothetical protein